MQISETKCTPQAVWEAEELKAQLLSTQSRLQEAEALSESVAAQKADVERQLQLARTEIERLQVKTSLSHHY